MIKAFLFDYDGVMTVGVADNIPAMRLAQNLGIPIAEASKWIVNIWGCFSTGLITEDEVWHIIEQQHGKPVSLEHRDIWYTWDELRPLPEMIELVQLLTSKGYPLGVVSNVSPVTAQLIREHGGYNGFDFLVLSYQVGARKPDEKIYEAALRKLKNVVPEEIMFLDDRESCVVNAGKLGMKTIHVTNKSVAIAEVRRVIEANNDVIM